VTRLQLWARWARWNSAILPKHFPTATTYAETAPKLSSQPIVQNKVAEVDEQVLEQFAESSFASQLFAGSSSASYGMDQFLAVCETSPNAEIYDELFLDIRDDASAVGIFHTCLRTEVHETASAQGSGMAELGESLAGSAQDVQEQRQELDEEAAKEMQRLVTSPDGESSPGVVLVEDLQEPDQMGSGKMQEERAGSEVSFIAKEVASVLSDSTLAFVEPKDEQSMPRQQSPTMEEGFEVMLGQKVPMQSQQHPSKSRPAELKEICAEEHDLGRSSHHISLDNVPAKSPRGSPQKTRGERAGTPSAVRRVPTIERSLELSEEAAGSSSAEMDHQLSSDVLSVVINENQFAGSAFVAARGLPAGSSETKFGQKKAQWRCLPSSHQVKLSTRRYGGPFAMPSALLLSADLKKPDRRHIQAEQVELVRTAR